MVDRPHVVSYLVGFIRSCIMLAFAHVGKAVGATRRNPFIVRCEQMFPIVVSKGFFGIPPKSLFGSLIRRLYFNFLQIHLFQFFRIFLLSIELGYV